MTDNSTIWIYKLTWKEDGGEWTYYGQSKNPRARFKHHISNPSSHAIYELVERIGEPEMDLLVYSDNPDHIDLTEKRYIQEAVERGERVINRFGVNYGASGQGGKGPVPGTLPSQTWNVRRNEARKRRKYKRNENAWKTCSICGRRLPASCYNTDRNRTSGLSSRCKDCFRLVNRAMNAAKRNYGAGSKEVSDAYRETKQMLLEWRASGAQGEHPGLPHPSDEIRERERAKQGELVCSTPDCDRRVKVYKYKQLCAACYGYWYHKKILPTAPPRARRTPFVLESINIRNEKLGRSMQ